MAKIIAPRPNVPNVQRWQSGKGRAGFGQSLLTRLNRLNPRISLRTLVWTVITLFVAALAALGFQAIGGTFCAFSNC